MSAGHVAVVHPRAVQGQRSCSPGEQLQPHAVDAAIQPRANISRNVPAWVMCLEFGRVQSPGDGSAWCLCERLARVQGVSPKPRPKGLQDELRAGSHAGQGAECVTNAPSCARPQCLEKEMQKELSDLHLGSSRP